MATGTALRPKHVPRRTCVGCGAITAKRTLIRVVRSPSGEVMPDPTGKKPGRGSYLCPSPACWDRAIARGRLARSLKATLSAADADALRSFARSLTLGQGETS